MVTMVDSQLEAPGKLVAVVDAEEASNKAAWLPLSPQKNNNYKKT